MLHSTSKKKSAPSPLLPSPPFLPFLLSSRRLHHLLRCQIMILIGILCPMLVHLFFILCNKIAPTTRAQHHPLRPLRPLGPSTDRLLFVSLLALLTRAPLFTQFPSLQPSFLHRKSSLYIHSPPIMRIVPTRMRHPATQPALHFGPFRLKDMPPQQRVPADHGHAFIQQTTPPNHTCRCQKTKGHTQHILRQAWKKIRTAVGHWKMFRSCRTAALVCSIHRCIVFSFRGRSSSGGGAGRCRCRGDAARGKCDDQRLNEALHCACIVCLLLVVVVVLLLVVLLLRLQ